MTNPKMQNVAGSLNSVWQLTKRNMLLFLKNKATVFFSLLAPVLIFVLYTVFLGSMQIDTMRAMVPPEATVDDKTLRSIFDTWMVSGVVGIACLTVALNSMLVIISDKEAKIINDFNASPVSRTTLLVSYFLAATILTFTICLTVLVIILIYLAIFSGVILSFSGLLQLFAILLLSCLSAVILMMCVMSLFKTNATITAFSGIFSALIGFLTGAYLPASILPSYVQGIAALIPGSHSTGLFRSVFMEAAFKKLPSDFPQEFLQSVKTEFASNLNFFGYTMNTGLMYLFLSGSIVLFFAVYLLIDKIRISKKK